MLTKNIKKIAIIGSPGSGKSYLSKKIANSTGIPIVHLDNEYWKPNWTPTEKALWENRMTELASPPQLDY